MWIKQYFCCAVKVGDSHKTILYQSFAVESLAVTSQKYIVLRLLRSFMIRRRSEDNKSSLCLRTSTWLQDHLLPLPVGKTHVFSRKRDELLRGVPFGAIVSRGRGMAAHTAGYAELLPLLHKLARSVPAYTSFQLYQMTPEVRVKQHVDVNSDGDSYV